MMQPLAAFKRQIRRFARDESATITVEVVMVMPLLLWGYFGLFVLSEAYRSLNLTTNVAYAMGDLISRTRDPMTDAFVNGLNPIQDIMTQANAATVLRVTYVGFDDNNTPSNPADDGHYLIGSHGTNGMPDITNGTLQSEIVPNLPTMYGGEELIVVETWTAFAPALNITLARIFDDTAPTVFGAFNFEGVAVTRPRFTTQLCWDTCTN